MKKQQAGFALLLVFVVLLPLSISSFGAWIIAGRYVDIIRERELCYHEDFFLKSVLRFVCQIYKVRRLKLPAVFLCEVKIPEQVIINRIKNQIKFVVMFDQPQTLVPSQYRLRIKLCDGDKPKRVLTCVVEKGERVFNDVKQRCLVVHHVSISVAV